MSGFIKRQMGLTGTATRLKFYFTMFAVRHGPHLTRSLIVCSASAGIKFCIPHARSISSDHIEPASDSSY